MVSLQQTEQPTIPSPIPIPATFSGEYESPDSERESPVSVSTHLTLADIPTLVLQAVPEDIMLPQPNHKVPEVQRSVPTQNHIQALPAPDRYQRYDYSTKLAIEPQRRSSSLQLWYMSLRRKLEVPIFHSKMLCMLSANFFRPKS